MTRLESLLHPGEIVLWRTKPAWQSARNSMLWQIAGVAGGGYVFDFLIEGFDLDRLLTALYGVFGIAVVAVLVTYFTQGAGVMVTDRRVLRSQGVFRPRREELERRHIAEAVIYEGDETLVLRAARPDVIRLLEPNSRASLRSTGEMEMPFPRASVENDAVLEALAIEPQRIQPVPRTDAVTNLHGARISLSVAGALLSVLGVWAAAEMMLPDFEGVFFAFSALIALGAGAVFGLWLVWPVARLTVSPETAGFFACTLYHPDWKAVFSEDETWRDDLRRAERRLSRLYGAPVDLESLLLPEGPPEATEMPA